jgi:hypothetical protein
LFAFVEFVVIMSVGGIALFAVLSWIRQHHPRWRNFSAFVVAAGAAYAASFALDLFVGACLGFYPFRPFTFPVFTWSGITIALHSLARYASVSTRWIQVPYLGVGGIAAMAGILGPHRYNIVVGTPLILFALFPAFLSDKSSRHVFPIAEYKLDAPVAGFPGLKEFSPTEYTVLGSPFEGETDYNAPPVVFLGRHWQLQLGTVHGKIYKIAPYLLLKNKQDANEAAMETLRYCTTELGKPAEQRSGFFVWDASDGNVVLQTAESADGFSVSIFLTSRSVRTLKPQSKTVQR